MRADFSLLPSHKLSAGHLRKVIHETVECFQRPFDAFACYHASPIVWQRRTDLEAIFNGEIEQAMAVFHHVLLL